MTYFDTKQIPGITAKQWERLRRLLDGDNYRTLEVPWLRSATGMTAEDAFTLMQWMKRIGCGKTTWLVFHDCAEHSVATTTEGVLSLPWSCPECEEDVTDGTEIQLEPRCVLTESVVFSAQIEKRAK